MDKRRVAVERRGWILLGVFVLAVCALLAPNQAGRVYAQTLHAVLIHSEPAEESVLLTPPAVVRLWFTEPVQLVEPSLTIYGPSGKVVAQGKAQELNGEVSVPFKGRVDGTYLVTWQVISQDTDPVSGSFVFSIRHPGGQWAGAVGSSVQPIGVWLQVLAHFLHFLGYAFGFGALVFLYLVVYPLKQPGRMVLYEPIWWLVNLGILVLLCAEGIALLAQSASLGTHSFFDLTFLSTVLGSSFGRALALRLGAALALWILVGLARQGNRNAVLAALLLGIVLALIDSMASHAITSPVIWLALLVTALHIVAMGAWLGGVIALLILWKLKAAENCHQEILARFSPLALACVAELVLTGVLLSGLHLARLEDLWNTVYGRVLTIKMLALALPLLFVALGRRKRTALQTRWWRAELLSLLGILVLAGALASLPPVR